MNLPHLYLPSATIDVLKARSALIQQARHFFLDRGFWEVDTPLLSAETVVDAHIHPVSLTIDGDHRFLQTSPELAMKRLLVAGSGSIFQFAHAVRAGEAGPLHNREFLLLEWYRVGASLWELMDDVGKLVTSLMQLPHVGSASYRQAFLQSTGIDPLKATNEELADRCQSAGLSFVAKDRDDLLNFLWADQVEPTLPKEGLYFIYHYPASQAALADVIQDEDGNECAERFELYARGIELANGYHECRDPRQLREWFIRQNDRRVQQNATTLPLPDYLLSALEQGLPDCSGVAVGFDRLVMISLEQQRLSDVIPFPDDRC
ncbi:EF-P lysine aminoacylase GenX [bacterium]|nr:EF-P lysine aminoacylase GenX [bacterium]